MSSFDMSTGMEQTVHALGQGGHEDDQLENVEQGLISVDGRGGGGGDGDGNGVEEGHEDVQGEMEFTVDVQGQGGTGAEDTGGGAQEQEGEDELVGLDPGLDGIHAGLVDVTEGEDPAQGDEIPVEVAGEEERMDDEMDGIRSGPSTRQEQQQSSSASIPAALRPALHPRAQLLPSTGVHIPGSRQQHNTSTSDGVEHGQEENARDPERATNGRNARRGVKQDHHHHRGPTSPSGSLSSAVPTSAQARHQAQNQTQDELRELTDGLAYNSSGERVDGLAYTFGTGSPEAGNEGGSGMVEGAGMEYPIFGRGFVRFVEAWLEERGLREGANPSPLLSAYLSLPPSSVKRLTDAAFATDDLIDAVSPPVFPINGTASALVAAGGREGMEIEMEQDVEEEDESGDGALGRAERMGKEVGGMLQHLIRSTSTNYLLLLSPQRNAPASFPILYHSPLATAFWHSLRGGPTTNLAKFVALSVPTTTTRRLAIPTGARSLDVKSRLNSLMRVQVRDVSGVGDAEMKWTRPEALIGSYGVKIVGWPTGEVIGPDGERVEDGSGAEEEIPQRNPSNNSVAQNKTLLGLVESGHLRIEKATQADKDAFAAQQAETAAKLAAMKAGSGGGNGGEGGSQLGDGEDGEGGAAGDGLLMDEDGNPLLNEAGEEVETGKGAKGKAARKPRLGPDGTPRKPGPKQPRTKSLLTLRPDGTIQTGGLTGPRKPGRPRKVPDPNAPAGETIGKRSKRGRPRRSESVDVQQQQHQQHQHLQQQHQGLNGEGESEVLVPGEISIQDMHVLEQQHDPNQAHAHLQSGEDELMDADMSLAQHAGDHVGGEHNEEEDPATAGYLEVNNMDSMPDMAEAESSAMALAHMRHSIGDEYTRYYTQEPGSPVHGQYLEEEGVGDSVDAGHHHHDQQGPSLLDMYHGQHGLTNPNFDFPHSEESQVAIGHGIPLISPFPHSISSSAPTTASGVQQGQQQAAKAMGAAEQAMVEQAVNAATAIMAGGKKRTAQDAGFAGVSAGIGSGSAGQDKRQRGF